MYVDSKYNVTLNLNTCISTFVRLQINSEDILFNAVGTHSNVNIYEINIYILTISSSAYGF